MHFVISVLRNVPDPRTGNAMRHSLLDLLTIALVASICGYESCVEFAHFAEHRETLFRELLDLTNGLPRYDTFSRLFCLLDPDALLRCFGRFLDQVGADGTGVLAVDGKALRRSFDCAAATHRCTWSWPLRPTRGWCSTIPRWRRARTRSWPDGRCWAALTSAAR